MQATIHYTLLLSLLTMATLPCSQSDTHISYTNDVINKLKNLSNFKSEEVLGPSPSIYMDSESEPESLKNTNKTTKLLQKQTNSYVINLDKRINSVRKDIKNQQKRKHKLNKQEMDLRKNKNTKLPTSTYYIDMHTQTNKKNKQTSKRSKCERSYSQISQKSSLSFSSSEESINSDDPEGDEEQKICSLLLSHHGKNLATSDRSSNSDMSDHGSSDNSINRTSVKKFKKPYSSSNRGLKREKPQNKKVEAYKKKLNQAQAVEEECIIYKTQILKQQNTIKDQQQTIKSLQAELDQAQKQLFNICTTITIKDKMARSQQHRINTCLTTIKSLKDELDQTQKQFFNICTTTIKDKMARSQEVSSIIKEANSNTNTVFYITSLLVGGSIGISGYIITQYPKQPPVLTLTSYQVDRETIDI